MISSKELRAFEIFQDLTESELENVAQIAQKVEYKAGKRIFAEKSLATDLYLVLAGKVIIKMGEDEYDNQLTTDTISPGEIFGWSALTDPFTFTAGAYAQVDTQLLSFDGERLRKHFNINNHVGYKIMMRIASVISQRIRVMSEKLVDCSNRKP